MQMNNKLVLRYILQNIAKYKYYVLLMIVIAAIHAVAAPFVTYMMKLILNDISTGQNMSFSNWHIFSILIVDIVCFFSYRLHGYFIQAKFKSRMREETSTYAIDNFLQKNSTFFQSNLSGALANKVNDIATNMPDIFEVLFDKFSCQLILAISGVYFIYQSGAIFGWIITIWVLSFVIVSYFCVNRINHLSYKYADNISNSIGKIVDIFGNILTVRIFGSYKFEKQSLSEELKKVRLSQVKLSYTYFWIFAYYGISFVFVEFLCLKLLIDGYNAGNIAAGDFVNVLTINFTLAYQLWEIAMDASDFSSYFGRVSQAISYIFDSRVIDTSTHLSKKEIQKGEIEFQNVTFNYGNSEEIFVNQSVKIQAGEKVGLVGHSGAGKSTFINLLLRLYNINEGKILIDGNDIATMDYETFYKAFGVVPQDSSLFHRSILDNIKYGNQNATYDSVIAAAKKAYAHEFISKLPDGYNTILGERGSKLSGGQKQRILIARAILKNAPILILDESTSQLDSITEKDIQKSLDNLMQNKTAIVIAHRLSTILNMDRILVFHNGEIVSDGKHEELLKNCQIYTKLWQTQIE